ALKRDAAPGVDGLTWQDYEADLDRKIEDLHARGHRGAYRALPSRRHYIPKADGQQRPLAIAALEDKIVQKAACAVLNAIYEEDFLGFSYGFRPKRSQHDALDALITGIHCTKVNYIFDADLRSFFDSVSQQWLIRFLKHRINDTRMLRLIQKWLKAGVLEGLYRRLDPRLCARWWSRIWRLRARHDTLSAADPAGVGRKPDSSSTRVTLAGTHDQWATVTARIQRPDWNRGMTPSCFRRFSGTTFCPPAGRRFGDKIGAEIGSR